MNLLLDYVEERLGEFLADPPGGISQDLLEEILDEVMKGMFSAVPLGVAC